MRFLTRAMAKQWHWSTSEHMFTAGSLPTPKYCCGFVQTCIAMALEYLIPVTDLSIIVAIIIHCTCHCILLRNLVCTEKNGTTLTPNSHLFQTLLNVVTSNLLPPTQNKLV